MGPSNGIRGLVHSLLEGRNGEVFATTDYGLFVYDPKRPPAPLPRLADHWDEVTLLFWTNPIRDSEGNFWGMRADRPSEISRWDGRAWRHQHVPFDAAKISCSMADDRGHVLLGKVDVRYDVSPAGVTTYTDYRDALVAAIARGARRFQPSRCVAVDGGKKLYAHFYTGQDIACYDGKQWSGRHFNEWISSLHESPKYGVLIQGGGQYYAWDGGQIRHVDTAHTTRWLWGENGYQPYEAVLLQAHPREYLPVELESGAVWPWLLRQPVESAAGGAERPAVRAASLKGVDEWNKWGSGHGWLLRGYDEGYWAAGDTDVLYRIFAEQVIECRLDQSPLAGLGHEISQVVEDSAHNLWFCFSTAANWEGPKLICKRVDGFALRGPQAAVEVADRGALDVHVAELWDDERPMRLFWRTDGGRWQAGEIGPLPPGAYQVEMIAMGPLGETTPKPIRCSIIARGPAAWVMPRIVGHDMEDDFVLRQAHDNVGIWILEDAVKHSPHNVHYWAALVDTLDQEERREFYDTIRPSRFAERASRDALKLNPGDPLLLVARARLLEPWAALEVLDELEKVARPRPRGPTTERDSPAGLPHSRRPRGPHDRPTGDQAACPGSQRPGPGSPGRGLGHHAQGRSTFGAPGHGLGLARQVRSGHGTPEGGRAYPIGNRRQLSRAGRLPVEARQTRAGNPLFRRP